MIALRRFADEGLRVELEVAGVQHEPGRGADGERVALGDGMGDRQVAHVEGTEAQAPTLGHLDERHLMEQPRLGELALEHAGGELGRVHRAAQALPQVGHGPEVILVGMGEHQSEQVVAALDDERGVGHDDVDAGMTLVGKGDAEVDHQPLAVVTIEVEVHADFARTAEGHEQQLR